MSAFLNPAPLIGQFTGMGQQALGGSMQGGGGLDGFLNSAGGDLVGGVAGGALQALLAGDGDEIAKKRAQEEEKARRMNDILGSQQSALALLAALTNLTGGPGSPRF